ncbi:radical SAM family heme chaperone HemW [Thiohalophilus thiocyanatoxydans]|uniref:Heme chaperone HemW n=1 Tax=Thiohalophilus thiocyanatoxydans TaxID=381308 RepID=A0A4V3H4Q7_9GAMM|nr:radical SAM family heme chaperone HemW [Thiohalophilus thiocyanatoxydans]TDY04055.1 anaerobic coproporphyrinogen III oxidase [Thiohalophilus thiocyanatoxydans]
MLHFTSLPPLSLYIHFPWCTRKCPYCDFNSHALNDELPERAYIDALLRDLEQDLPLIWGRKVNTIFMGGGTPSLFSPESLEYLLSQLRARLALAADIEITLEANPDSSEAAKFAEFRAAGINRLSIGIQSFDADQLQKLGRIHDRQQAFAAAEAAHAAGFDNFNLDLMFALPDQTLDQALADLHNAIALEPTHLSHYQLTIEPNTWFYHHPPPLPDDDLAWEMQSRCQAVLGEHGYAQYEVSAYARPDRQCRHNRNYWEFGDYLGIGAGAHDKLSDAAAGRIVRRSKQRNPRDYLQDGNFVQSEQVPDETDVLFEFMLNALRLNDGFELALFEHHTGLSRDVLQAPLQQAVADGLIEQAGDHIKSSMRGQQYLNDLIARFLPDAG